MERSREVERQAAEPSPHERPYLMAEEYDAEERVEIAHAEHAADQSAHQRHDAKPEQAHAGGERKDRTLADWCEEKGSDDRRAQEIDRREQPLWAVPRAKPVDDIGADRIAEADQPERGSARRRRNAANRKILREVGGDEHQLEAASEESDRHREISGVARGAA